VPPPLKVRCALPHAWAACELPLFTVNIPLGPPGQENVPVWAEGAFDGEAPAPAAPNPTIPILSAAEATTAYRVIFICFICLLQSSRQMSVGKATRDVVGMPLRVGAQGEASEVRGAA
jgi:hypothetical protein